MQSGAKAKRRPLTRNAAHLAVRYNAVMRLHIVPRSRALGVCLCCRCRSTHGRGGTPVAAGAGPGGGGGGGGAACAGGRRAAPGKLDGWCHRALHRAARPGEGLGAESQHHTADFREQAGSAADQSRLARWGCAMWRQRASACRRGGEHGHGTLIAALLCGRSAHKPAWPISGFVSNCSPLQQPACRGPAASTAPQLPAQPVPGAPSISTSMLAGYRSSWQGCSRAGARRQGSVAGACATGPGAPLRVAAEVGSCRDGGRAAQGRLSCPPLAAAVARPAPPGATSAKASPSAPVPSSPTPQLGGRAGSSSGGSSGEGEARRQHGSGRPGGAGRRRKARQPGLFEVTDISPPPQSLGIHALPPVRVGRLLCATGACGRATCLPSARLCPVASCPTASRRPPPSPAAPQNTLNGDQIEVEGSAYVVRSVVMQYKLVRGRYRRALLLPAAVLRGSCRAAAALRPALPILLGLLLRLMLLQVQQQLLLLLL